MKISLWRRFRNWLFGGPGNWVPLAQREDIGWVVVGVLGITLLMPFALLYVVVIKPICWFGAWLFDEREGAA